MGCAASRTNPMNEFWTEAGGNVAVQARPAPAKLSRPVHRWPSLAA